MRFRFSGGPPFSPFGYSVTVSTKAGRTPLLPLYALFQFIAPEELTLRTLYEFDELGGTGHTLCVLLIVLLPLVVVAPRGSHFLYLDDKPAPIFRRVDTQFDRRYFVR